MFDIRHAFSFPSLPTWAFPGWGMALGLEML
jgi:hypothetical protein